MSSKNSFIEETKNSNISRHDSAKKIIFSNNLSPLSSPLLSGLTSKRRPPLSKLASLPFRYAFDGFSRNSSQLTKQNTIPSPNNTSTGFSNKPMSAQQHFSSSSLSGRCNSSQNGDFSASEAEVSEENLNMRKQKQNSISSSDLEDFKSSSVSNSTTHNGNQNKWEKNMSGSSSQDYECSHIEPGELVTDVNNEKNIININNNQTLPTRLPDSDLLVSNLKKYAVRRHHSAPQSDAKWLQAKRKAIVVQMYDTEKSYVEALKILVTKYYLPLKEKDIVERNLTNDIFYKIPEIHVHHELLLSSLKAKFDSWDSRQTIGDILLNIFAKQSVVETYISFVNNYRTSQEAIRICKEQSSLFSKFVEQQAKDHRGKLNLKDLIIQPVQRIPRYELYIKDFLKCTATNHPDYQLLLKAQKEVHNLAEKIDQVHKEFNESYGPDSQSVLQIVQDLTENLDDLVTAYRYYIRHDMISIISPAGTKKDRCIFLFSDLIVLTSCKRRSGNINKRTNSIILNSPIGKQYLENIKHKLIMKIQLEDIDLTGGYLSKKLSIEKEYLEDDLTTITRISELAKILAYPHQNLDECIKEITFNITRQLTYHSSNNDTNTCGVSNVITNNISNSNNNANNSTNNISNTNNGLVAPSTPEISENKTLNQLILTINTNERVEILKIAFNNSEQRSSWEKCFIETKKNFFESSSRKPATFLNVIAIPRNRSGVQFTCASARTHLVTSDPNDVWICSTDGQMGQVCILNSVPELSVSSCNTVCNSRITCVQCVPPYRLKRIDSNGKKVKETEENQEFEDYPFENNDNNINSMANIEKRQLNDRHLLRQMSSNLEPDFLLDYDSSDDDDIDSHSGTEDLNNHSNLSAKDYNQSVPSSSNIPLFTSNYDLKHSTMWIGNDDGSLHIFQFSDSAIKTVARKNRITKQFSSGIQCLLYMDNKVFVSLKNGELAIFKRNYSIWNYDNYAIKTIAQNSFNCMIAVAGKLWCAGENEIIVLSPNLISIEHHFTIDGEKNVLIATGGNSSFAVWIASQTNLDLKLYHATKYILLAEINIRQCVTQKLKGLDDLIRIHKLSCLRITCLYVCKDTLWIGTSAGIICNVKIPHINSTTNKLSTGLSVNAINHGHFGPVRFITSVEVAKTQTSSPYNSLNLNDYTYKDTCCYKTIILSGGEGYEEYKLNPSINLTTSSGNNSIAVNINTIGLSVNQSQNTNSDNQLNVNSTNNIMNNSSNNSMNLSSNNANNSTGALLQSQNSFASSNYGTNFDENSLGKDDLINYVITWEI